MNKIHEYIKKISSPEEYLMTADEEKEYKYLDKGLETSINPFGTKRLHELTVKSFRNWLYDEPSMCDDKDWYEVLILDGQKLGIKTCQIDTNPYVEVISEDGTKIKKYLKNIEESKFDAIKPFIDYWFALIDSREFHNLIGKYNEITGNYTTT